MKQISNFIICFCLGMLFYGIIYDFISSEKIENVINNISKLLVNIIEKNKNIIKDLN